jgi:hypothetical protein
MVTVVCVLKSGGDFRPKHVARLYTQVIGNVPIGTSFICLTDQPDEIHAYGIPAVLLDHSWYGHGRWAKLEMFRFVGPCLYLDLDLTVVGELHPLVQAAEQHEFIASDGYIKKGFNSSIMAWRDDLSWIYKSFAAKADEWITYYATAEKSDKEKRGHDQAFLNDTIDAAVLWQDILPGMVMLWYEKWQEEDCRVVISTSRPRPWERTKDEAAWRTGRGWGAKT